MSLLIMIYPTTLIHFNNHLSLKVPVFESIKPIYEDILLSNPTTPPPHWAKIWESSLALTQFLLQNISLIKNKKVLEVGAGIGLPSFSIAHHTQSIEITDYNMDAVHLIQENIELLSLVNATSTLLDWQLPIESNKIEVLLLSDINYDPSQFESLVYFVNNYIQKGCTIILATPERITAPPFIQHFNPFIKETHIEVIHNNNTATKIGIFILKH